MISDTLKREDNYCFQDICLYGLNAINVFFRENQHNPEAQLMIFNMVMRMVKLYLVDDIDNKINQKCDFHIDKTTLLVVIRIWLNSMTSWRCFSLVLDLLHFINNAIIRYSDQVEYFVGAGGVEQLLEVLPVKIIYILLYITFIL